MKQPTNQPYLNWRLPSNLKHYLAFYNISLQSKLKHIEQSLRNILKITKHKNLMLKYAN